MVARVPSSSPRPEASRHPGLPGWRALLAAVAVVGVLALVLHLLYL